VELISCQHQRGERELRKKGGRLKKELSKWRRKRGSKHGDKIGRLGHEGERNAGSCGATHKGNDHVVFRLFFEKESLVRGGGGK